MEEKKTKRFFEERCGGGNCRLKNECRLHIIPRDWATNNVIKTPVLKAGDSCGAYQISSIAEVYQEIRMLKAQAKQLDYQQN